MRLGLLAVALLPLVSAQSNSTGPSGAANSPSPQITVITSVSSSQGLASGRVPTTFVTTILITSTIQPAASPSAPTGNPSDSGSSSAPTSTSTANLPTGTVSVVTDPAPSPGAKGGAYGPDDNYINAARSLQRNTLLLGVLTAVVGYLAL